MPFPGAIIRVPLVLPKSICAEDAGALRTSRTVQGRGSRIARIFTHLTL
jgi:hypothetical protein